jgi:hypothetical protein
MHHQAPAVAGVAALLEREADGLPARPVRCNALAQQTILRKYQRALLVNIWREY